MGGGGTWEFPTMHLCRPHEDGEQGKGGLTALQSGGKGWDLWGGWTGCPGGPAGWLRQASCISISPVIWGRAMACWLCDSGLSLQH